MTGTIHIADELLRTLPESGHARLAFVPAQGEHVTHEALAAAVGQVQDEIEDAVDAWVGGPTDDSPPLAGEWSWLALGVRFVVSARKSSVRSELVRIARALEVRGVSGRFEAFEEAEIPRLPIGAPAMVCRLVADGERAEVIDVAMAWCGRVRGEQVAVSIGDNRWVGAPWPTAEELVRSEAGTKRRMASVIAGPSHRVRAVGFRGAFVTCVAVLGETEECSVSSDGFAELLAVVETAGPMLRRADIYRTRAVHDALYATRTLPDDLIAAARDPAIGARLCGPGDKPPESSDDWRTEQHGPRTLLVRRDVGAWLRAPLPPKGPKTRRIAPSPPARIDWST